MKKRLSGFLLILGLVSLVAFAFQLGKRVIPVGLSIEAGAVSAGLEMAQNPANPSPLHLLIPSVNIKLSILPGKLDQNRWTTTDQGVSYLITSPTPGENGNSILYGHNWPNLLGNLKRVAEGDSITIEMSDGTTKEFVVASLATVLPTQTHVLDQTTDSRLTVYTCAGFLDRQRLVVTAYPKNDS